MAPSGEWSGRAGVVRFARLIHRRGRVLGGPSVRAASGGIPAGPGCHAGWTAANRFAGLLSCHGDTARTADLPSLPNLRDHNGPGRIPAGTAIGTGACLA